MTTNPSVFHYKMFINIFLKAYRQYPGRYVKQYKDIDIHIDLGCSILLSTASIVANGLEGTVVCLC